PAAIFVLWSKLHRIIFTDAHISRPNAPAILRLITSSNLAGGTADLRRWLHRCVELYQPARIDVHPIQLNEPRRHECPRSLEGMHYEKSHIDGRNNRRCTSDSFRSKCSE